MQPVNYYYRVILWANLLIPLSGCGNHSENYRMMHRRPSGAQEGSHSSSNSSVDHSPKLNADEVYAVLQKTINNLFEQLTKCCYLIKKDRRLHLNFTKINEDFHFIQYKSSMHNRDRMNPISIASVYGTRVSEQKMKVSKKYKNIIQMALIH